MVLSTFILSPFLVCSDVGELKTELGEAKEKYNDVITAGNERQGSVLGKYITNLVLSKIETDKGRKKVT